MTKIIAFILAFSCFLPVSVFAKDLILAAAANLQYPLEDLKAEFTRETGIPVKSVTGSSGQLTSQIKNGAPFDVFLSADMKYPAKIFEEKLSSQPRIYAYGVLVLWSLSDPDLSAGVKALSDKRVGKIALADPRLAPYGRQAVNALRFYHLYDELMPKLVYAESISQVNQFIGSRAADIGFTSMSVVLAGPMKSKGKWIEVDPKSYQPIAQGAVLLEPSGRMPSIEARRFYEFLFSPQARAIFRKYGYRLP